MKRLGQTIGLGLLAVAFAFSAARALRPARIVEDDGIVRLRFAHVTLHEGVVSAYDEAIREYEALHPEVRVEQILVPLQLWRSWLRTQMIGDTAPDIADMDRGHGDEFVARHFLPLDAWTERPNPYNAGTELAEVPWRDTFVDGLLNAPAYRVSLQQIFGIPQSIGTVRVFANAPLLRTITGRVEPPKTYEEFMALCAQIRDYSARNRIPLVPISGSNGHAPPLLRHLFSSQTQRLSLELNPYKNLRVASRDVALAYLRGEWRWQDPPLLAGVEIMGEVGREMAPGFVQLKREDSMFYFTQARAVMLVTGSWEADTVRLQAPFELAVFELPVPGREDPRFGPQVLGPTSELGVPPGNAVGVSRRSRHPEQAVDFLRFLSSRQVARKFADRSRRLSSVVGVPPSEETAVFAPLEEGWPAGFNFELPGLAASGEAGECHRLFYTHIHRLVGPGGNTAAFVRTLDEGFAAAARQDLASASADGVRNSRGEDALLLALLHSGAEEDALRVGRLLESQTLRELEAAQIHHVLRTK